MAEIFLCVLDDIQMGSAKGFEIEDEECMPLSIFVVHDTNNKYYAYRNSCPHAGSPLDWMPNRFLSSDLRQIQCASHDARFDIKTGACIAGPCSGKSLQSLSISLRDSRIYLLPFNNSEANGMPVNLHTIS